MSKTLTIQNLKTLSFYSGATWSGGFRAFRENGRYVLKTIGYAQKKTDSDSITGLNGLNGFSKRDETATAPYKYIYAISVDGKIWKFPENQPASITNVNSLAAGTYSRYPDIYVDDSNNVLYTSSQYLGKYDGTTWTDNYGDFTSGLSSSYNSDSIKRPFIPFEDIIFIGNKDYLAKVNNDSTGFDSAYKQLPQKYEVNCGAQNGKYVLIGANKNKRGALFLWDGYSDGWNYKYFLDNDIYAIAPYKNGWIFASGGALYLTNGFSVEFLDNLPQASYTAELNLRFNNFVIVDDKVIFGAGVNVLNSGKTGFYVYDLKQKIFDFIEEPNGNLYYTSTYGLYYNPTIDWIMASHTYDYNGGKYAISVITTESNRGEDGTEKRSYYITPKISFPFKVKINKVKINYSFTDSWYSNHSSKSLTITCRINNKDGGVWGYGQTSAASTASNELIVNGTTAGYSANVGDQVLILDGTNAYLSSHISSIANQGTTSETLTLEDNLNGNTENSVWFNILPFTKIATKTTTSLTGELEFVNNAKIPKLNNVYVQLEVKQSYFPITINSITIEYE